MSLATQSLKITSAEAAQLWEELQQAQAEAEPDELLESLWSAQSNQEQVIDAYAELADQIEAELAALKARKQSLVKLHDQAIRKLERWRSGLDRTVLRLNEQGMVERRLAGRFRQISIVQNPPRCEVLVAPDALPQEYQRVQQQITPNRKAILDAWKQGVPVPGTRVSCQRRVVYALLKSTNFDEYQAINHSSK